MMFASFCRVKMANVKTSKYLGIIIFSMLLTASCERTKDKMYRYVNGTFCFKRLTASNEYGCTSSRGGNTGVVHFIRNEKDIGWLLHQANAGPYIVVVTFEHFTRKVLLQFKKSEKVSGLILKYLSSSDTLSTVKYSPDDTCPNRNSGLEDQCDESEPWNKAGDSLLFLDLGFPVIFIDSQETLDFLEKCFETHNAHDLEHQSSRSLCSMELTSHMLAAVDTQTCIRRTMMFNNLLRVRYCDPLGDWSIYLPIFPRIQVEKERSVILVMARIDGLSMFDEMVPGAKSPVTGIVSLLTTAHYLTNMIKARTQQNYPENNVVFLLLNGESFDYIGSSRIIYEMKNGSFPYKQLHDGSSKQSPPLRLNNVGLIVELDEITSSLIFNHSSIKDNTGNNLGFEFLKIFDDESKKLGLTFKNSIKRLPPASVQRFLREDPDIPGVVINSYNSTFSNKFYHSILDTSDKLKYEYSSDAESENEEIQTVISKVSLAVARSLYELLYKEKYAFTVTSDTKLVKDLLHCYLESASCSMFERFILNQKLPNKPLSLYVGVHNNNNVITALTGMTLAFLTGEHNSKINQSSCHKDDDDWIYQKFWAVNKSDNNTGYCITTMMNYTLALSPAFDIEGYNWTSNLYSSWTESVWQQMSARIFLKPSKHHEILTLSVGLVVLIFSFIVVYCINIKANILFNNKILGSHVC